MNANSQPRPPYPTTAREAAGFLIATAGTIVGMAVFAQRPRLGLVITMFSFYAATSLDSPPD